MKVFYGGNASLVILCVLTFDEIIPGFSYP